MSSLVIISSYLVVSIRRFNKYRESRYYDNNYYGVEQQQQQEEELFHQMQRQIIEDEKQHRGVKQFKEEKLFKQNETFVSQFERLQDLYGSNMTSYIPW